jgi:hypothetical protein
MGIPYVLCAIEAHRDSRNWRRIFCVSRHCLSLCTANPFLVCGILHEPYVARVVLEIKRENPSLSYVPGLSGQGNAGSIVYTLFGEIVGIQ